MTGEGRCARFIKSLGSIVSQGEISSQTYQDQISTNNMLPIYGFSWCKLSTINAVHNLLM